MEASHPSFEGQRVDTLMMPEQASIPFDQIPAPKPAAEHVGSASEVQPRPHEETTEAGIPHPAHRAD